MEEKLRIMVVDDELIIRESLFNYFKKYGHVVETASSGIEALEKLKKAPFHVLFADIKMPGMDGMELLEKVKDEHPDTMVVIITAYGSIESAANAMRIGASDYLLKPFKPDQLSLAIERISHQRRLISEHNVEKVVMQQEKLASIGRLSAGVAHELNNPLTTILTSAMLIQEEFCPDQSVCSELQIVIGEALRCRKIVRSLLDFARQTEPAKEMCNINDVVRECLVLTRKQAAFNDVNIAHDLSEDIPLISADKGQIQQAMINLILNAIEATDPGGKITISTTTFSKRFFSWYEDKLLPLDDAVEIRISDTGKGIDPDELDKIFDPFFTTGESGTGLGLAITHGIIEQHGGGIDVKSKKGRGTTFIIRLPVNRGNEDDRR